jgi:hypothetical protein
MRISYLSTKGRQIMATTFVFNHASKQATKLAYSLIEPSSSNLTTPRSITLKASGQDAVHFFAGSLPPLGNDAPLLLNSGTTLRTDNIAGGRGKQKAKRRTISHRHHDCRGFLKL